jgi:ubiquinone/menaquinone biosynthesis C-methylase UbiE
VRALLERVHREAVELGSGVNRLSQSRTARIVGIDPDGVRAQTSGIATSEGRQLALNFELDGHRFFFVTRVRMMGPDGALEFAWPATIYVAEKRDLFRASVAQVAAAPRRVRIRSGQDLAATGEVVDWTYHGMAVDVPAVDGAERGTLLGVRSVDGVDAGAQAWGEVRHVAPSRERPGWTRLGLAVSRVAPAEPIVIERYEEVPVPPAAAPVPALPGSAPVTRVVEFQNQDREPLRGIVDQWGDSCGATAVVITPPWGRTKETLLPLSATIVRSFRAAGRPVVVLRFDGTRRRGESFVPDACLGEGREHLEFSFSQAVDDTRAAIRFLRSDEFRCDRAVLVTFSLSSVEGRRVVSRDRGRDLSGWVSVVGIADLASALHVISGGVDFGYGLLRGLSFGRQELFGVLVDIDHAGLDAIRHGLAFLEDAKRDMAGVRVPVSWLHGHYDAWVDLDRVRSLLSCGDSSQRRLIELPTGHQLRTSRKALDVFRLVAGEVARMAGADGVTPLLPDLGALTAQRAQERGRLPRGDVKLAPFWRDYLMGRGESVGIEILTATDTYRDFMARQVALLELRSGHRVADLGSGTGDFVVHLLEREQDLRGVEIHMVDFVGEALSRASDRFNAKRVNGKVSVSPVVANLDVSARTPAVPFASEQYDSVLASLLVGYVENAVGLLGEMYRILRHNGLLVLSALRSDADISKIYADSLAERYSERPLEAFGAAGGELVDRSLPSFLNTASRILDLEERGRFRFFEPLELKELVEAAGFARVEVLLGLGDPPQAILIRGRRP